MRRVLSLARYSLFTALLTAAVSAYGANSSVLLPTTATLTGTWYYTSVTDAAGKETKMNNRESYITFSADATYEQYVGRTIVGKYYVKGDTLTLSPENSEARVYQMVFDAGERTLTLKNDKGGYALERR